jgi:hypothetical protein
MEEITVLTARDVYVIGVDPGDSVGIRSVGPNGLPGFCWQGAADNAGTVLRDHLLTLPAGAQVVIACERYTQGPRGPVISQHSKTVQGVIAVTRGIATGFGCTFVEQAPAAAKKIAPNSVLRSMGLLATAKQVGQRDANDVNDAARHAVLLLATRFATVYQCMRGTSA